MSCYLHLICFLHRMGVRLRSIAAALLLGALCSAASAGQWPAPTTAEVPGKIFSHAQDPAQDEFHGKPTGTTTAQLEAILSDKRVARRISAWGLSVADVRHDVFAMSTAHRAELLRVMKRRWPTDAGQSEAALQAQFLVTLSLMRESTLFASILSPGNFRSFQ